MPVNVDVVAPVPVDRVSAEDGPLLPVEGPAPTALATAPVAVGVPPAVAALDDEETDRGDGEW